jgi:hypothetical protein
MSQADVGQLQLADIFVEVIESENSGDDSDTFEDWLTDYSSISDKAESSDEHLTPVNGAAKLESQGPAEHVTEPIVAQAANAENTLNAEKLKGDGNKSDGKSAALASSFNPQESTLARMFSIQNGAVKPTQNVDPSGKVPPPSAPNPFTKKIIPNPHLLMDDHAIQRSGNQSQYQTQAGAAPLKKAGSTPYFKFPNAAQAERGASDQESDESHVDVNDRKSKQAQPVTEHAQVEVDDQKSKQSNQSVSQATHLQANEQIVEGDDLENQSQAAATPLKAAATPHKRKQTVNLAESQSGSVQKNNINFGEENHEEEGDSEEEAAQQISAGARDVNALLDALLNMHGKLEELSRSSRPRQHVKILAELHLFLRGSLQVLSDDLAESVLCQLLKLKDALESVDADTAVEDIRIRVVTVLSLLEAVRDPELWQQVRILSCG